MEQHGESRHPIDQWLVTHDLTQSWLAARLGISEPFLSQIINGKKQPSINVAAAIEDITGVAPRDLVLKTA